MIKPKAIIIFALAIVFGIGAVLLVQNWMNKRSAQVAQKSMKTTMVVVAKTSMPFGAVIREENLIAIEWPARATPRGSFRQIKDLVNEKEPRVVLRPVEANEPLLKTKVSGFGGRASLSAVISDEMRGATIRVNDVNGVAGFVLPGDRVDVLLTRDREGGKQKQGANLITDVLLQNVKVLAIDQNLNESKEKPSVAKAVTMEVSARQAQKLVLAQTVGTLSLALRNSKNAVAATTRTVSIADLRRGEVNDGRVGHKPKTTTVAKKKIVKRRANSLSRVKVVRGLKESEYQVVKEKNFETYQHLGKNSNGVKMMRDELNASPVIKKTNQPIILKNKRVPISLKVL
jgi:pilus assembly protein CpaB